MINIREVKEKDLLQIQSLQPQDWPDIIYFFEWYLKSENCYPICAELSGKIVGVACAILNIETGWLAHIIVSEKFRRKGIGYKLTETCMDVLAKYKCKTQLLIASKEGALLYPKLGFLFDCNYQYYQGFYNNFSQFRNIISYNSDFEKDILRLDYEISGEKRKLLTPELFRNSYLYINSNKELLGYYLTFPGEGTILAKTNEAGIELLKYKHAKPEKKSVIPESNACAMNYLNNIGFINYNSCPRMYFGSKIKWHPDKVFSRIGGFYG